MEASSADARDFDALYERVGPASYRLAQAILGDAAAAEDVVQEAFLRLWGRRDLLADPARLDGYAARTVRNLSYKRLRRRVVEARARADLGRDAARAVASPPTLERCDLEEALAALPPTQREVVHLRVHEGLSMVAIAARTGVPLGTVHSRYRYALSKLRSLLAKGDA